MSSHQHRMDLIGNYQEIELELNELRRKRARVNYPCITDVKTLEDLIELSRFNTLQADLEKSRGNLKRERSTTRKIQSNLDKKLIELKISSECIKALERILAERNAYIRVLESKTVRSVADIHINDPYCNRHYYKTKLCPFYFSGANCLTTCSMAHGVGDIRCSPISSDIRCIEVTGRRCKSVACRYPK